MNWIYIVLGVLLLIYPVLWFLGAILAPFIFWLFADNVLERWYVYYSMLIGITVAGGYLIYLGVR